MSVKKAPPPSTNTIRILGVMTGTSCDGLDAACISVDGDGWEPLWSRSAPYPAALRAKVLKVQAPGTRLSLKELLELNRDLGKWYGESLRRIITTAPADQRPDAIANHGQTVAHFPDSEVTLQLGDPTRISRDTGLTVVTSFRDGDLSAGGQGAPLAPLFHAVLATAVDGGPDGVAIHNIGGISNVTYVSGGKPAMAFDTGPGNIWINAATEAATRGRRKFDDGGRLAAQGKVNAKLLGALLKHPYFARKPPKSTGRDEFAVDTFLKLASKHRVTGNDLVATATALTIETIASSYERFILSPGLPLGTIVVCGGGARNPMIMKGLRERLSDARFMELESIGMDPQLIEAQAFAFFGFLALLGHPVGGPWTGAKGFGPPAHVVPGENWHELVRALAELT